MNEKDIKNQVVKTNSKLKLKELIGSVDSLMLLGQKEGIGIVTQWKLVPIIKKVRTEYQNYLDINNAKIKEFGEKVLDDKGKETGSYKVKPENDEKYKKEIDKLLEQEVDIEIPDITYSELKGDNEKFTLATNVLVDLSWLIKQG